MKMAYKDAMIHWLTIVIGRLNGIVCINKVAFTATRGQ